MSDDLDDFLRQAAERRAKRQQQRSGQSAPPPQAAPPQAAPPPSPAQRAPSQKRKSQPSPQSPSSARRPPIADSSNNVRPSVGNLEPSLADRHVYSDLSMADERMEEHLKEAFRSDLSPDRFPSDRKKGSSGSSENVSATAPTGSEQSRAMISSVELIQQLRDPQTLRLAIIAHEILRRPFQ